MSLTDVKLLGQTKAKESTNYEYKIDIINRNLIY